MGNSLLRLFGRLRKNDPNHAEEGFQLTPDGKKVRIERRLNNQRRVSERRLHGRQFSIERRAARVERRIGVDWRSWIE